MQNNIIFNDSDMHRIEAEVRSAIEQSHDVPEVVRQLILHTISGNSVDIEAMRMITSAVLRGAGTGIQKGLKLSALQNETACAHIKQAVAGLDAALEQFAEASRLRLEEAEDSAQIFFNEDLARARANLKNMEEIFLESLQSGLKCQQILREYTIDCSVVGVELKETLAEPNMTNHHPQDKDKVN